MSNQVRPIFNPFTSEFQLMPTIDRGIEIRHEVNFPITVKAGFTRIQPDMKVDLGVIITVEEGAELLVL
jgi:hypothetical protein